MALDTLTIVIPTKNRHLYLERIIDYYSDKAVQVIIADATLEPYGKNIPSNFTYYHYPQVPYCSKLKEIFSKINSPYSLLCADDDFILLEAIENCLTFLDKNRDYSSAQGHYVFFIHLKKKLFYTPGYTGTIGCDINENDARARLKRFVFTPIQLYYSVHRTETLRDIFNFADNKFSNLNLVELFICMNALIKGKHKVLPLFYSVRELLYGSAGKSHSIDKLSTLSEYKDQYNACINEIIRLLAVADHISFEESSAFVQRSVKELLENRFEKISLKNLITSIVKKSIPFSLRKEARYYGLLLNERKRIEKNQNFSRKVAGFPFKKEGVEKEQLKKIEEYIFKYNIQ